MNLYFECNNGISGDMATAALIDLGGNIEKLKNALDSMNLNDEFSYEIKDVMVNGIRATDFNVILKEHHHHHHEHRNLKDVSKIIDNAKITDNAKKLAKKIFQIVAEAEAKVHSKNIDEVHFHEVGAIDSIVDIVSFSVLFDDINPNKIFISTLTEGTGSITCAHGELSVPVPAVLEIVSKYKLQIKITDNNGEMITPTGAAIIAAIFEGEKLPNEMIIEKVGYGAGKRKYKNPTLRVMKIR